MGVVGVTIPETVTARGGAPGKGLAVPAAEGPGMGADLRHPSGRRRLRGVALPPAGRTRPRDPSTRTRWPSASRVGASPVPITAGMFARHDRRVRAGAARVDDDGRRRRTAGSRPDW